MLEKGFSKAPGNLRLVLTLTGLLERSGDVESAISVYEGHLKASPRSRPPIVLNNLASLLSDYRDDQASLDRAKELIGPLGKIEVPHFKDTIGWISYKRGEYELALSNLEKAVESLPKLAVVRYHLGLTYAALNRIEDASKQLKTAFELNKGASPLNERIEIALSKLPKQNAVE